MQARKPADSAFVQAAVIAEKVAKYRHAALSAVRLAGDINNATVTDNASLDELLVKIKDQLRKLGPLIDLPGTELSFAGEVACSRGSLFDWRARVIHHRTAIFRQINKDRTAAHHDALEFPDGEVVLLTLLCEGQQAIVRQLPAEPKTATVYEAAQRPAYVGWPV
jgi:hypothetical protein